MIFRLFVHDLRANSELNIIGN